MRHLRSETIFLAEEIFVIIFFFLDFDILPASVYASLSRTCPFGLIIRRENEKFREIQCTAGGKIIAGAFSRASK